PGLAVVGRAIEIGTEVVELVAGGREVGSPLLEGAGLDAVDHRPLGEALRRHVLPGLAAVARDVDEAVVRAGPEDAGSEGGLGGGEDRVVVLDAGVVLGDRTAGGGRL